MRLLAPIDNIRFDIEDALEKQTYSMLPLPFIGMDSKLHLFSYIYLNFCIQSNQFPLNVFINRVGISSVPIVRQGPMRQGQFVSVSTCARRQIGGVQALATRPVQEGRRVRVLARVRHEQDARVLLLLEVQPVRQQRVRVLAHQQRVEDQGLRLVRPWLLSTR